MPPRASSAHCKNRCRAPRCKGLSKKSGFKSRCCLCTHHGTGLCWHHQKLDGPQITARKPERAAVLGAGVEVRPSTVSGAGGGLFAKVPFASNDVITEYDGDHIDKQQAHALAVQTHVKAMGGNYVDGLKKPVDGRGGGSFANESGPGNAEFMFEGTKIYLKVKAGKVIKPGHEVFVSYGRKGSTSRAVAMGSGSM
jgi:hypothetical protein